MFTVSGGAIVSHLQLDAAQFTQSLSGVNTGLSRATASWSSQFGALTHTVNGASLAMAALGAVGVSTMKDMAMAFANAVESENLFEMSLNHVAGASKEMRDWSIKLRETLVLNDYEVRKNAGTMFVMIDSLRVGSQEAMKMGKSLTELAYDMASFYNISNEEAFYKLQAGITGVIMPLKRLGIDVQDNTVKQWALAHGFQGSWKEADQATKVMYRYQVIMDRTYKAQGDLARTMETPINQLRILKEQWHLLQIKMGDQLYPVFKLLISAVRNLQDAMRAMPAGLIGAIALFGLLSAGVLKGGLALGEFAHSINAAAQATRQQAEADAILIPLEEQRARLALASARAAEIDARAQVESARTKLGNAVADGVDGRKLESLQAHLRQKEEAHRLSSMRIAEAELNQRRATEALTTYTAGQPGGTLSAAGGTGGTVGVRPISPTAAADIARAKSELATLQAIEREKAEALLGRHDIEFTDPTALAKARAGLQKRYDGLVAAEQAAANKGIVDLNDELVKGAQRVSEKVAQQDALIAGALAARTTGGAADAPNTKWQQKVAAQTKELDAAIAQREASITAAARKLATSTELRRLNAVFSQNPLVAQARARFESSDSQTARAANAAALVQEEQRLRDAEEQLARYAKQPGTAPRLIAAAESQRARSAQNIASLRDALAAAHTESRTFDALGSAHAESTQRVKNLLAEVKRKEREIATLDTAIVSSRDAITARRADMARVATSDVATRASANMAVIIAEEHANDLVVQRDRARAELDGIQTVLTQQRADTDELARFKTQRAPLLKSVSGDDASVLATSLRGARNELSLATQAKALHQQMTTAFEELMVAQTDHDRAATRLEGVKDLQTKGVAGPTAAAEVAALEAEMTRHSARVAQAQGKLAAATTAAQAIPNTQLRSMTKAHADDLAVMATATREKLTKMLEEQRAQLAKLGDDLAKAQDAWTARHAKALADRAQRSRAAKAELDALTHQGITADQLPTGVYVEEEAAYQRAKQASETQARTVAEMERAAGLPATVITRGQPLVDQGVIDKQAQVLEHAHKTVGGKIDAIRKEMREKVIAYRGEMRAAMEADATQAAQALERSLAGHTAAKTRLTREAQEMGAAIGAGMVVDSGAMNKVIDELSEVDKQIADLTPKFAAAQAQAAAAATAAIAIPDAMLAGEKKRLKALHADAATLSSAQVAHAAGGGAAVGMMDEAAIAAVVARNTALPDATPTFFKTFMKNLGEMLEKTRNVMGEIGKWMLSPWGALTTAILASAAAAVYLYQKVDAVKEFMNGVFKRLGSAATEFAGVFMAAAREAFDALKPFLAAAGYVGLAALTAAAEAATIALKALTAVLKTFTETDIFGQSLMSIVVSMTLLKNVIGPIFTLLGGAGLGGALKNGGQTAITFGRAIGDAFRAFGAVRNVAAAQTAIGGLAGVMGRVIVIGPALAAALTAIRIAIGALAGPAGLAVAAVGLIGTALLKLWQMKKQNMEDEKAATDTAVDHAKRSADELYRYLVVSGKNAAQARKEAIAAGFASTSGNPEGDKRARALYNARQDFLTMKYLAEQEGIDVKVGFTVDGKSTEYLKEKEANFQREADRINALLKTPAMVDAKPNTKDGNLKDKLTAQLADVNNMLEATQKGILANHERQLEAQRRMAQEMRDIEQKRQAYQEASYSRLLDEQRTRQDLNEADTKADQLRLQARLKELELTQQRADVMHALQEELTKQLMPIDETTSAGKEQAKIVRAAIEGEMQAQAARFDRIAVTDKWEADRAQARAKREEELIDRVASYERSVAEETAAQTADRQARAESGARLRRKLSITVDPDERVRLEASLAQLDAESDYKERLAQSDQEYAARLAAESNTQVIAQIKSEQTIRRTELQHAYDLERNHIEELADLRVDAAERYREALEAAVSAHRTVEDVNRTIAERRDDSRLNRESLQLQRLRAEYGETWGAIAEAAHDSKLSETLYKRDLDTAQREMARALEDTKRDLDAGRIKSSEAYYGRLASIVAKFRNDFDASMTAYTDKTYSIKLKLEDAALKTWKDETYNSLAMKFFYGDQRAQGIFKQAESMHGVGMLVGPGMRAAGAEGIQLPPEIARILSRGVTGEQMQRLIGDTLTQRSQPTGNDDMRAIAADQLARGLAANGLVLPAGMMERLVGQGAELLARGAGTPTTPSISVDDVVHAAQAGAANLVPVLTGLGLLTPGQTPPPPAPGNMGTVSAQAASTLTGMQGVTDSLTDGWERHLATLPRLLEALSAATQRMYQQTRAIVAAREALRDLVAMTQTAETAVLGASERRAAYLRYLASLEGRAGDGDASAPLRASAWGLTGVAAGTDAAADGMQRVLDIVDGVPGALTGYTQAMKDADAAAEAALTLAPADPKSSLVAHLREVQLLLNEQYTAALDDAVETARAFRDTVNTLVEGLRRQLTATADITVGQRAYRAEVQATTIALRDQLSALNALSTVRGVPPSAQTPAPVAGPAPRAAVPPSGMAGSVSAAPPPMTATAPGTRLPAAPVSALAGRAPASLPATWAGVTPAQQDALSRRIYDIVGVTGYSPTRVAQAVSRAVAGDSADLNALLTGSQLPAIATAGSAPARATAIMSGTTSVAGRALPGIKQYPVNVLVGQSGALRVPASPGISVGGTATIITPNAQATPVKIPVAGPGAGAGKRPGDTSEGAIEGKPEDIKVYSFDGMTTAAPPRNIPLGYVDERAKNSLPATPRTPSPRPKFQAKPKADTQRRHNPSSMKVITGGSASAPITPSIVMADAARAFIDDIPTTMAVAPAVQRAGMLSLPTGTVTRFQSMTDAGQRVAEWGAQHIAIPVGRAYTSAEAWKNQHIAQPFAEWRAAQDTRVTTHFNIGRAQRDVIDAGRRNDPAAIAAAQRWMQQIARPVERHYGDRVLGYAVEGFGTNVDQIRNSVLASGAAMAALTGVGVPFATAVYGGNIASAVYTAKENYQNDYQAARLNALATRGVALTDRRAVRRGLAHPAMSQINAAADRRARATASVGFLTDMILAGHVTGTSGLINRVGNTGGLMAVPARQLFGAMAVQSGGTAIGDGIGETMGQRAFHGLHTGNRFDLNAIVDAMSTGAVVGSVASVGDVAAAAAVHPLVSGKTHIPLPSSDRKTIRQSAQWAADRVQQSAGQSSTLDLPGTERDSAGGWDRLVTSMRRIGAGMQRGGQWYLRQLNRPLIAPAMGAEQSTPSTGLPSRGALRAQFSAAQAAGERSRAADRRWDIGMGIASGWMRGATFGLAQPGVGTRAPESQRLGSAGEVAGLATEIPVAIATGIATGGAANLGFGALAARGTGMLAVLGRAGAAVTGLGQTIDKLASPVARGAARVVKGAAEGLLYTIPTETGRHHAETGQWSPLAGVRRVGTLASAPLDTSSVGGFALSALSNPLITGSTMEAASPLMTQGVAGIQRRIAATAPARAALSARVQEAFAGLREEFATAGPRRGMALVSRTQPVAPKAVRGPEASDPGYIYHATNAERLQEIADSGKLLTHKPWEFTDQSTWPDGGTGKRAYFGASANNSWTFAPEEGTPVLLRAKRDALPVQRESGTGDMFSTKPVAARALEYLGADGRWHAVVPTAVTARAAGTTSGTYTAPKTLTVAPSVTAQAKPFILGADGQPLVVHHGTVKAFPTSEMRAKPSPRQQIPFGLHFTPDETFAQTYAKGKQGRIITANLRADRVLDADQLVAEGTPEFALAKELAGKRLHAEYADGTYRDGQFHPTGPKVASLRAAIESTSGPRAQRIIQAHGYDALSYDAKNLQSVGPNSWRVTQQAKTYVVFSPEQVADTKRALKASGQTSGTYRVPTPKPPSPAPKHTVTAYKLMRVDPKRPGQLFPLYIDADTPTPLGTWVDAQVGDNTRSKLGKLAPRPGWHAGNLPMATHIGSKANASDGAPSFRPDDQVWVEVEMPADRDWQTEANARARRYKSGKKRGEIIPKTAEIRDEVPVGGHYRYKTNPNMTGEWLIGGAMRVKRILSDADVARINAEAGTADLPRLAPFDPQRYGFDATEFTPQPSTAKTTDPRLMFSLALGALGLGGMQAQAKASDAPPQSYVDADGMRHLVQYSQPKPSTFSLRGLGRDFRTTFAPLFRLPKDEAVSLPAIPPPTRALAPGMRRIVSESVPEPTPLQRAGSAMSRTGKAIGDGWQWYLRELNRPLIAPAYGESTYTLKKLPPKREPSSWAKLGDALRMAVVRPIGEAGQRAMRRADMPTPVGPAVYPASPGTFVAAPTVGDAWGDVRDDAANTWSDITDSWRENRERALADGEVARADEARRRAEKMADWRRAASRGVGQLTDGRDALANALRRAHAEARGDANRGRAAYARQRAEEAATWQKMVREMREWWGQDARTTPEPVSMGDALRESVDPLLTVRPPAQRPASAPDETTGTDAPTVGQRWQRGMASARKRILSVNDGALSAGKQVGIRAVTEGARYIVRLRTIATAWRRAQAERAAAARRGVEMPETSQSLGGFLREQTDDLMTIRRPVRRATPAVSEAPETDDAATRPAIGEDVAPTAPAREDDADFPGIRLPSIAEGVQRLRDAAQRAWTRSQADTNATSARIRADYARQHDARTAAWRAMVRAMQGWVSGAGSRDLPTMSLGDFAHEQVKPLITVRPPRASTTRTGDSAARRPQWPTVDDVVGGARAVGENALAMGRRTGDGAMRQLDQARETMARTWQQSRADNQATGDRLRAEYARQRAVDAAAWQRTQRALQAWWRDAGSGAPRPPVSLGEFARKQVDPLLTPRALPMDQRGPRQLATMRDRLVAATARMLANWRHAHPAPTPVDAPEEQQTIGRYDAPPQASDETIGASVPTVEQLWRRGMDATRERILSLDEGVLAIGRGAQRVSDATRTRLADAGQEMQRGFWRGVATLARPFAETAVLGSTLYEDAPRRQATARPSRPAPSISLGEYVRTQTAPLFTVRPMATPPARRDSMTSEDGHRVATRGAMTEAQQRARLLAGVTRDAIALSTPKPTVRVNYILPDGQRVSETHPTLALARTAIAARQRELGVTGDIVGQARTPRPAPFVDPVRARLQAQLTAAQRAGDRSRGWETAADIGMGVMSGLVRAGTFGLVRPGEGNDANRLGRAGTIAGNVTEIGGTVATAILTGGASLAGLSGRALQTARFVTGAAINERVTAIANPGLRLGARMATGAAMGTTLSYPTAVGRHLAQTGKFAPDEAARELHAQNMAPIDTTSVGSAALSLAQKPAVLGAVMEGTGGSIGDRLAAGRAGASASPAMPPIAARPARLGAGELNRLDTVVKSGGAQVRKHRGLALVSRGDGAPTPTRSQLELATESVVPVVQASFKRVRTPRTATRLRLQYIDRQRADALEAMRAADAEGNIDDLLRAEDVLHGLDNTQPADRPLRMIAKGRFGRRAYGQSAARTRIDPVSVPAPSLGGFVGEQVGDLIPGVAPTATGTVNIRPDGVIVGADGAPIATPTRPASPSLQARRAMVQEHDARTAAPTPTTTAPAPATRPAPPAWQRLGDWWKRVTRRGDEAIETPDATRSARAQADAAAKPRPLIGPSIDTLEGRVQAARQSYDATEAGSPERAEALRTLQDVNAQLEAAKASPRWTKLRTAAVSLVAPAFGVALVAHAIVGRDEKDADEKPAAGPGYRVVYWDKTKTESREQTYATKAAAEKAANAARVRGELADKPVKVSRTVVAPRGNPNLNKPVAPPPPPSAPIAVPPTQRAKNAREMDRMIAAANAELSTPFYAVQVFDKAGRYVKALGPYTRRGEAVAAGRYTASTGQIAVLTDQRTGAVLATYGMEHRRTPEVSTITGADGAPLVIPTVQPGGANSASMVDEAVANARALVAQATADLTDEQVARTAAQQNVTPEEAARGLVSGAYSIPRDDEEVQPKDYTAEQMTAARAIMTPSAPAIAAPVGGNARYQSSALSGVHGAPSAPTAARAGRPAAARADGLSDLDRILPASFRWGATATSAASAPTAAPTRLPGWRPARTSIREVMDELNLEGRATPLNPEPQGAFSPEMTAQIQGRIAQLATDKQLPVGQVADAVHGALLTGDDRAMRSTLNMGMVTDRLPAAATRRYGADFGGRTAPFEALSPKEQATVRAGEWLGATEASPVPGGLYAPTTPARTPTAAPNVAWSPALQAQIQQRIADIAAQRKLPVAIVAAAVHRAVLYGDDRLLREYLKLGLSADGLSASATRRGYRTPYGDLDGATQGRIRALDLLDATPAYASSAPQRTITGDASQIPAMPDAPWARKDADKVTVTPDQVPAMPTAPWARARVKSGITGREIHRAVDQFEADATRAARATTPATTDAATPVAEVTTTGAGAGTTPSGTAQTTPPASQGARGSSAAAGASATSPAPAKGADKTAAITPYTPPRFVYPTNWDALQPSQKRLVRTLYMQAIIENANRLESAMKTGVPPTYLPVPFTSPGVAKLTGDGNVAPTMPPVTAPKVTGDAAPTTPAPKKAAPTKTPPVEEIAGLRTHGNLSPSAAQGAKSFVIDGRAVLLPTVGADGKPMSDDDVLAHYQKDKRHLGIFETGTQATVYARGIGARPIPGTAMPKVAAPKASAKPSGLGGTSIAFRDMVPGIADPALSGFGQWQMPQVGGPIGMNEMSAVSGGYAGTGSGKIVIEIDPSNEFRATIRNEMAETVDTTLAAGQRDSATGFSAAPIAGTRAPGGR